MALPRFSSPMLPHFLLGFFLLAVAPTATTAQPLYQFCRDTDANYTANSTFQSNLNRLLPSLAANGSSTGFFNGTAGDAPDRVYGLVLCRGDAATGPCRTCLATAAEGIVQNCLWKKSSVVWYDNCMLRYSNVPFFSVPDDTLKVYLRNANSLSEVIQFNQQRTRLMAALVQYATYNNSAQLFATGEAEYLDPTPTMYGLVQCTRDQSADDCNACLTGIVGEIPSTFSQWRGARILKATCNFRYELYRFYNGSGMLSVPLAANATPPAANATPPAATLSPATEEKKNSTGTILAIVIPVGAVFVLISIICLCFYRRRAEKKKQRYMAVSQDIVTIESLLFDLPTLRAATANFSDLNKLGQGGFGSVYKGLLPDGKEIAVKRLLAGSGQGVEELKNEVVLLAKLQHRNLVRLLGVCLDGEEKLLVYEYVPNKSLDTFLFDPIRKQQLNWETRHKVIAGISRGLQYLHEDSQVKIIHRDLKASNILLDADMNSKISDFGLARLFDVDQTQASTTRVVGTYGYMAPEYAMRGLFSNKSDVFSFGVLVLEIVTGRRNSDISDSGTPADILKSVWEHWTNGTVGEIVDPSLGGRFQRNELMRCIHIALLCVQEAPTERPTMSTVVLMLSTYSISLQVPSRPALFMAFSQPDSDVLRGALEYSSTDTTHQESRSKSILQSPTPNEVSITELEPR